MTHTEEQSHPRLFEAEFAFNKNEDGEVDRMVMVAEGVTGEFKKVP